MVYGPDILLVINTCLDVLKIICQRRNYAETIIIIVVKNTL